MALLMTASPNIDPELLNRCLVVAIDESCAQTAAIQPSWKRWRLMPPKLTVFRLVRWQIQTNFYPCRKHFRRNFSY